MRKMYCSLVLSGACIAGLLLADQQASAAVITWEAAADVLGASDIDNSGTTVEALSGVGFAGTTTLNTVDFVNGTIFGYGSSPTALNPGDTTGDATLDTFLRHVRFGGGGGLVSQTVADGLLTSGDNYLIQVWFTDLRVSTLGRVMQFGDGNANTVDLQGDGGTFGQYAIGTFTADGTSQTLTLAPQGFGNGHITAYQVRAVPVPEPSSFLLLGLTGLIGSLATRRRKR